MFIPIEEHRSQLIVAWRLSFEKKKKTKIESPNKPLWVDLRACDIVPAERHVRFLFVMYDPLHCSVSRLVCSLVVAIFPTEMTAKEKQNGEKKKNKNRFSNNECILSKNKWNIIWLWLWMDVMLPSRSVELLRRQVQRGTHQQNHRCQRPFIGRVQTLFSIRQQIAHKTTALPAQHTRKCVLLSNTIMTQRKINVCFGASY